MKLLFDQNLSPRLVALLGDLFPGSVHVRDVGLASSDDMDVWAHAKQNGLAIVSKDADFRQLSFQRSQWSYDVLSARAFRNIMGFVCGARGGGSIARAE